MQVKKTPLYEEHLKLGGNVVDYAGWYLPVKYTELTEEHLAVREKVGIFDVSHMGEIVIKGPDAKKFVNYLVTNDIDTLYDKKILYTFMCYENGTCVDDLLVYRYADDYYYLVVNASNVDKDFEWIKKQKGSYNVEIENISDSVAEIAIQGPKAQQVLQKMTDFDLSTVKFFHLERDVKIAGANCMISRTGYTGEDGFEVYCENEDIVKIWNEMLEKGKPEGIMPCGLGCRDTLRFEASLPLYGHEISDEVNPLEGGFKFFVALNKESDFIGKAALQKQDSEGLSRIVCGFELLGKGIPREGYRIEKDGADIGYVTTGYMSPSLKKPIGNALVKPEFAKIGTEFELVVRKKKVPAKVISKRFLKSK